MQVYYREHGGIVRGPTNLAILRSAVNSGRIQSSPQISTKAEGPWIELCDFEQLGDRAFIANQSTSSETQAQNPVAEASSSGPDHLASAFGTLGKISVMIGLMGVLSGSLMLMDIEVRTNGMTLLLAGLWFIGGALGLFAMERVLGYLKEIRDHLKVIASNSSKINDGSAPSLGK